ncbi:hypothetical protein Aple_051030 [Acrocarpospora pleiomorpha]|uniref:Uncharacterized protein n=1 Tax=Acrocarpospora pleiomorpha TaxID=90975 RepID=A0A5M3XN94_9ACTN|nr:hypothetical protein [Acrocarpospora pleiomorpha]GES22206.1 hypothetical protein Aple_051030 [Acrocarpospora pleiomorpha]
MPVHVTAATLTSATLSAVMVHAISNGTAFTVAAVITLGCGALVVGTLLRYLVTRRRVSGALHTHMALHRNTCCNPDARYLCACGKGKAAWITIARNGHSEEGFCVTCGTRATYDRTPANHRENPS